MKLKWELNKIINFVIITLVITAVYQTGMLWLEGTTSHNFFYTVFTALGNENNRPISEVRILEPETIVLGYGNKKFSLFYPKEEYNDLLDVSNGAIRSVLSEGKRAQSEELDWNQIFQSKCILLKYNFSFASVEYLKSFQLKNSVVSSQMDSFDTIAVVPARGSGESLKVYFIDSIREKSHCYTLEKEKYSSSLYNTIELYQQKSNENLIYISTRQREFNIFKENVFVPQWTQSNYEYPIISRKNPFEEEGKIYASTVENAIERFFKNFASKWNWKDENDVFCFSDETTVVKYHQEGLLEYFNYENYGTVSQSISSAYAAALYFMKNDSTLNTNIYLTDVKVNIDEIILYFDYHLNNYPIVISQEERQKTGISHAIEVTVRGNTVKRYRRYAYNFVTEDTAVGKVNQDFLAALNEAIINSQNSKDPVTKVDDIKLGYYVKENDNAELKWFTEIQGKLYLGNTMK